VRRSYERAEILSVLIDADAPMNPRDIAIGANMPRNNVDQLLFKISKAGEVLKAARGRYVHSERSDLIDAPPRNPHKNDKKIRNDEDEEYEEEEGDAHDA
jgi:hypothetical protein